MQTQFFLTVLLLAIFSITAEAGELRPFNPQGVEKIREATELVLNNQSNVASYWVQPRSFQQLPHQMFTQGTVFVLKDIEENLKAANCNYTSPIPRVDGTFEFEIIKPEDRKTGEANSCLTFKDETKLKVIPTILHGWAEFRIETNGDSKSVFLPGNVAADNYLETLKLYSGPTPNQLISVVSEFETIVEESEIKDLELEKFSHRVSSEFFKATLAENSTEAIYFDLLSNIVQKRISGSALTN